MDEHILTAAVRLNEVEAFLIIVEFHCAPGHRDILSLTLVHLTLALPRHEAREGGRGYRDHLLVGTSAGNDHRRRLPTGL